MMFLATYDVSEKKAKKTAKRTRSGLHREGASDMSSEDETDSSVAEDDGEEEEESGSPLRGEGRKGGRHKSGGEGAQEEEGLPCG